MPKRKKRLEYLDFEIAVGAGAGCEYPVTAASSAGAARETMRFPYDEIALERYLDKLEIALLRSGGARRQTLTPEEQEVREFGSGLFAALFTGAVRSRYDVCRTQAAQAGKGLRLKLNIASPELAVLPWEFMYDEDEAEYVCLSRSTPLVRHIALPRPIAPLTVQPPLRILGMVAAPKGMPKLKMECERERVERATKQLRERGLVELVWLAGQTGDDLQEALWGGPWHVFHFIGHGGFDRAADEGVIVLADERGEPRRLHATHLARLLADHDSMRLVFLNSCSGARGSTRDIFSSTAAILVRRGVPAVLAMQHEISDTAAIQFARGFYHALAYGMPVDTAVSEARKMVSRKVNNTVEWGTPVLYMRSFDGVLFDLAEEVEESHVSDSPKGEKEIVDILDGGAQLPNTPLWQKLVVFSFFVGMLAGIAGFLADALSVGEWMGNLLATDAPIIASATAPVVTTHTAALTNIPVSPTAPVVLADTSVPLEAGAVRISEKDGAEMVYVPAGEFTMGSTEAEVDAALEWCNETADDCERDWFEWEYPQHTVYLDAYWIDKYEVTNAQFKQCVDAGVCTAPTTCDWGEPTYQDANKADHPVVCVNWENARKYCEWAGKRLPTEAEWEKAARGTDGRRYPWGNDAASCDKANYYGCVGDTVEVGSYPAGASPYGARDMAGNVWEWTADWYDGDYYANSPARNPTGPSDGSAKVVRGGSWLSDDSLVRVANRDFIPPVTYNLLGLRCLQ